MTLVGRKIPSFEDPVCNLFKERILEARICYSADLNDFRGDLDRKETLKYYIEFSGGDAFQSEL